MIGSTGRSIFLKALKSRLSDAKIETKPSHKHKAGINTEKRNREDA